MIVGIHQPNYIPWLGYFRKVLQSDVFVLYDNVQMPMGKSYVTRCQAKGPGGPGWLTVPTPKSGTPDLIGRTPVMDGNWMRKHVGSIRNWYARSPWVDEVCGILETALGNAPPSIASFNGEIIVGISTLLGISDTEFVESSDCCPDLTGAESIEPILHRLGATVYLTGSGAGSMRHLDVDALAASGIETRYLSTEFAAYPQRHGGEFVPGLSVLDAILNIGPAETKALLAACPPKLTAD